MDWTKDSVDADGDIFKEDQEGVALKKRNIFCRRVGYFGSKVHPSSRMGFHWPRSVLRGRIRGITSFNINWVTAQLNFVWFGLV